MRIIFFLKRIITHVERKKPNNNTFFFGIIYNYPSYKDTFTYKYNIPTFNWTVARWAKRLPKQKLLDPIYLNTIEENQPFRAALDSGFRRVRYVNRYNYLYLKIKGSLY